MRFLLRRPIPAVATAGPLCPPTGLSSHETIIHPIVKLWGGAVDVTLVNRDSLHHSCILSNLVINGTLPMRRIELGYGNLQAKGGVVFAQSDALSVDPEAREVTVRSGDTLYAYSYDSACFSPITSSKASWLTASFQYDPTSRIMKRVDASFAEAPEPTSDGMQQMYQWADNIFADSFG